MERIGDDVRLVLRRFGPAEDMGEVVRAWPRAVGEAIAHNAWPARIARDGTLHVATSSSAWAFELAHLEADVRSRLSSTLGKRAPKRLRFAPGRLPERGAESVSRRRDEPPPPSEEALAQAARLAAGITDEELRALVARAAAASLSKPGSGRPL
jgi:hypothetical protein